MPCGFCRNLGLSNAIVNSHYVKNCGELAKHECQKCGRLGHTQSRCTNVPLISFTRKKMQAKPRAPVRVVRPDAPFIVNAPAKPVLTTGAWSAGAPKPTAAIAAPVKPVLPTGAWSAGAPKPSAPVDATKKPVVQQKKSVRFSCREEALVCYKHDLEWMETYIAQENDLRRRVEKCSYSSGLWSSDPECY